MQFKEEHTWIEGLGISYHLGIDGISLWLVLLTTFMTPICVLAAWNSIEKGPSGFMISLLMLETAMLGVFCALDLFLFFVFWEAMLIPMYLLIGIWGGHRRIYATIKFVLYTMAGSALMLVGILYLYFQNDNSFNLMTLYGRSLSHQNLLFLAFFIAFAIKVPLFPFHTWLPDAHVEAPTVGSVILAGVLLKMGTYGIVRFCMPLFPEGVAAYTPLIVTLSVIGIIFLRRIGRNGATRPQKTGRLFECKSFGVCCAWTLRPQPSRRSGGYPPNDKSWVKHRRTFLARRDDL